MCELESTLLLFPKEHWAYYVRCDLHHKLVIIVWRSLTDCGDITYFFIIDLCQN